MCISDGNSGLRFKLATQDWEHEQIHALNYDTFVEEIPQYPVNPSETLVDKFHLRNCYVIGLVGDQLVGMLSFAGERPFSLDQALPDLDRYLPAGAQVCEIRMLSVRRGYRRGRVVLGLFRLLGICLARLGFDAAIASGYVRQVQLLEDIGFRPFGPLVGHEKARYQPMILTWEAAEESAQRFLARFVPTPRRNTISLLPGPVQISSATMKAFSWQPISHRSDSLAEDFQLLQQLLCRMVRAHYVQLLVGSGTLANDTIAAQLSLLRGRGLVLSNGEFGERLVDHARRFGLDAEVFRVPYGLPFRRGDLECQLDARPELSWVWAVHCETSTGVLNDVELIVQLCNERRIRLCLDCISSIGTVPIDLRPVFLASGASGLGLASAAGIAFVFHNHLIDPESHRLPRCLDLGLYGQHRASAFGGSSNLLEALLRALSRYHCRDVYADIATQSHWLRQELTERGFRILAPQSIGSPAVLTIVLPREIDSQSLGDKLLHDGFDLSYKSGYLLQRNWIQICLVGTVERERLQDLLTLLSRYAANRV